ncbi:MAG: DUF1592 domain-containing protein [Armatimonadaceae bacterium]
MFVRNNPLKRIQRTWAWAAASVPLGALVVCAAAAPPAKKNAPAKPAAKPAPNTATFEKSALPFVTKYCLGCHQGDTPSAGVSLSDYKTDAQMLQARNLWEKVGSTVASRHMPPPGMPAPSDKEREAFVSYVQGAITKADCAVKTPGRVTLRRLNRAEYNNTVRDLLGVTLKPADEFPSDDVGYGFDNIGDVLSISPLLMEKYLDAAREVSRAAIYAPEDRGSRNPVKFGASQLSGAGDDFPDTNGRILMSAGATGAEYDFNGIGEYAIRVTAFQQQAGPEPAKMAIRVGPRKLREQGVRAKQNNPTVYEATFDNKEIGKRRVEVEFLNDYYDPENKDPKMRGGRNLVIQSVEIVPRSVRIPNPTTFPVFQNKVMALYPQPGADGVISEKAQQEATRKIVASFLPRAFRRPVTASEIDRMTGLAARVRKLGGSFEKSLQAVVQATLVSPNFLFMVEPNPVAGQKQRPLNDYELATRLSYFLWSSMPDERLMTLASQGKLKDSKVLTAEAKRMMKDPKAKALADNFAGQWLNLRKIAVVSPDPKTFPAFDDKLRSAMRTETEMFFDYVVKQDRPILEFLDSDYTFLNETLAKHYGNDSIKGDQFVKVALKGNQRGGLVTQASILTLTSNPTRTSPVKRGKWVMENILGTPPPPAPPNVPELPDDKADKGPLTGTLRQRLEQHRANPACASCHRAMDGIGFGLENFDAIGAWRMMDGEAKVDSSATMPDGKSFSGPSGLQNYLLGQKGQFTKALTEKLLTFALGRGIEPYDRCNIDDMAKFVANNNYKFSSVVEAVVISEPFRFRASGLMPDAPKSATPAKPAPVKSAPKKKAPARRGT